MFDIIGDIHGHADHLEALLQKMGYKNDAGYYKHPDRKVIFVGDFIDRGPKIRETLSLVRRMTDENSAYAVMGNHEYNALCFHTEISKGKFLREHSKKNLKQHQATLEQFSDHRNEFSDYLDWFRTLPLIYDDDKIRVVHACWDKNNIERIQENLFFTKEFLIEVNHDKESSIYKSIEETLKGKEHVIPGGHSFKDKDNNERTENRFKWWLDPAGKKYEECYFENVEELNGKLMERKWIGDDAPYPQTERPVFCGHYWLMDKEPSICTKNVACVDYSVAKGNILSAYRRSGETELKNDNFVWV